LIISTSHRASAMKNINITDFYNVFYLALPLVGDF